MTAALPNTNYTAKRAARRVVWISALLVALVGASEAFDIWRSHGRALTAVDRELDNLANAIAEQTARSLQSIDLLLRDNIEYLKLIGAPGSNEQIHEYLKQQIADVPQVRAIGVANSDGALQYSSRSHPPLPINLSDRPFFIAQRDHPDQGLFIGEPQVDGIDGAIGIFLSRRLEDAHGQFRGVVYALSDVEYFQQFYKSIRLGEGNAIALVRADGVLLARYPAVKGALGKPLSDLEKLLNAEDTGAGALRLRSPYDGTDRIISLRRVRDFPVVVSVSRDERIALASWREEAYATALGTLGLSVLAALLLLGFVRQLKRLGQTEQSLRESEERYECAMTGSGEGHWDWDLDTDRVFVSARLRQLHGLPDRASFSPQAEHLELGSAANAQPLAPAELDMHPDDRLRLETAVKEHLEGRTPRLEVEYRVRLPDGGTRWLLTRGQCFRDAVGHPHRMAGSVTDITARKRAEQEKQALEVQLRQSQKMEAIGTLAGGIAHDFNNILGGILGYGELALKSATTDKVRRYLGHVMHAGNRAKALVERILAFSRSGMAERVPVHVESVVRETLDLLRASLPAHIELKLELNAGDASIMADATQIHQVAMNLCTNAIQAMGHGGTLSVKLNRTPIVTPHVLSNGILAAGDYLTLSVSDTGTGIAPEVLERIFDPFFTTKGIGVGTGLGLSLIHSIVRELGGGIDVESKPGVGSTFIVYLPIAGETHAPFDAGPKELPRGRGETILLVDDEQALVLLGEETLAALGYEPVGFTSSIEALEAFRAEPQGFDAVLTDETMPEMTGTDLTFEVRKLRPDIPVVLMSGYISTTFATRANAAGVAMLLCKPLQAQDIAEALAQVLKRPTEPVGVDR